MSSSFSAQQISIGKSLYRKLLQTQSKTFQNHPEAILAAKNETRSQFLKAKQNHKTQEQIQDGFKMAQDVVTLLKMNVVQGKWDQSRESWSEYPERGSRRRRRRESSLYEASLSVRHLWSASRSNYLMRQIELEKKYDGGIG